MSISYQPLVFTGISQYSADFQSILNRAVQLGSLPLKQLQNQQADIQQRKVLAANLSSAAADLATSLDTLSTVGDSKALVASSTDSSVVSATVTGAAATTSYTIANVTSIARAASESSLTVYPDGDTTAVSTTGTVRLTVGSQQFNLTLGSGKNNLQGLRDAINAANTGATATILTTSSGNYLSLSANTVGATTLTLTDDPTGANTNLITSTNQGANSVFELNGIPVSEPATQINNVIPGVTLTISGKTDPGETVSISLNSDRSKLSAALQTMALRYNSVAQQVNAQIGPAAGLLSGNSIIRETRSAMTQIVNYRATSGSVLSLSDLGVTLSQSGQMSFDQSKLNGLSDSQLSDALTFVSASGVGALKKAVTQLSDPATGAIYAQINQFTAADTRIGKQVDEMTARISIMQTTLQSRLQAADGAIALLTSQQSLLTSSIQSLEYTSYGKKIE